MPINRIPKSGACDPILQFVVCSLCRHWEQAFMIIHVVVWCIIFEFENFHDAQHGGYQVMTQVLHCLVGVSLSKPHTSESLGTFNVQ